MLDNLHEAMSRPNLKTNLFESILSLGLITESEKDQKTVDQLIQQLDSLSPESGQPIGEEAGLTAFLMTNLLWQLPELESGLREKVGLVSQQAVKAYPQTIGRFAQAETALIFTLEQFCHQAELPTTYFQLNLFNYPKAEKILAFICRQTAARYQKDHPEWLFEPYEHPGKHIPGIWMSQTKQHFNPQALLKMERPTPTRRVFNGTRYIQ